MNGEIGAQAVRAQVARIFASEGFVRSHRMRRFLEFVVEETLAGRAANLGEYGVAVSVFDRADDFEPALDPIVRNDARRLRVKLAEYYRTAAHPSDPVWIDIPKGGYVPVFVPIPSLAVEAGASELSATVGRRRCRQRRLTRRWSCWSRNRQCGCGLAARSYE